MKKFKVFVIMYKPQYGTDWNVSQEGYSTEENAIDRIERICNFDGQLKRTAHWIWESDNGEKYKIKEIEIV